MRAWTPLLVIGGLASASPARAQASGQSAALAEQLFTEGRDLLIAKHYEEACTKLEQSLALDRAPGTLGNLAFCNEQRGRFASAWGEYREVADRYASQPERAAVARKHAEDLEPRLSKLHVVVPPQAQLDGLEIRVDGTVLPKGSAEWSLPVDGGSHRIEATAPGHEPASQTASIAPERARVEIVIPVLAEGVKPPEEIAVAVREPDRAPPPKPPTVAYVLGGVGVASLAVGAVFGTIVLTGAPSVKDTSRDYATRNSDYKRLDAEGWVANITLPVGAVLTGVALYLILRAPSSPAPRSAAFRAPLGVSF